MAKERVKLFHDEKRIMALALRQEEKKNLRDTYEQNQERDLFDRVSLNARSAIKSLLQAAACMYTLTHNDPVR